MSSFHINDCVNKVLGSVKKGRTKRINIFSSLNVDKRCLVDELAYKLQRLGKELTQQWIQKIIFVKKK